MSADNINSPFSNSKRPSEQEAGINSLNDHCLLHIFQYLPIVDRVRIERVSKRWKTMSLESWRSFKTIDQSDNRWGFRNSESLRDNDQEVMEKIFRRCGKYLTSILFDKSRDLDILSSVAKFCPNIQDLHIEGFWYLNLRSFIDLAENCNKLISISLNFEGNSVCDDALSLLFEKNKDLKSVKIIGGDDDIKGCAFTGKCLQKLNAQSIESIEIIDCETSSMPNRFHALRSFSKLKKLKLMMLRRLNNDIMKDIGLCYETLTTLSLSLSSFNNANFIGEIAKLKNLEDLDLSNTEDDLVNDEILGLIGTNCKLLKELCISGCRSVTNAGLANVISLPNLRDISIAHLESITDEVFFSIQDEMPALERINCSSCPNMGDTGLIKLIDASKNLKDLDLSHCSKVTNELFRAAIRMTKMRKNKIVLELNVWRTQILINNSPFLHVRG